MAPQSSRGDRPHMSSATRVAVREIRETAWRALVTAGASAGEAATAADIVLAAEIHDSAGLSALRLELGMVPTGSPPVTHIDGTLVDPAQRGPLLLGPLAADLAAALGRSVLLPGTPGDTALQWALSLCALATGVPLGLSQTDGNEALLSRVIALPDGGLLDEPTPAQPHKQSGYAAIQPWPDTATAVRRHPVALAKQRRVTASRHGILVDTVDWQHCYAASRQFLVPDT